MKVEYFAETVNKKKEKGLRFLKVEEVEELKLHDEYKHKNKVFRVVDIEVVGIFALKVICHEIKNNNYDKKSYTKGRTSFDPEN